jgi:uncharacterized protein (TIGR02466 family)
MKKLNCFKTQIYKSHLNLTSPKVKILHDEALFVSKRDSKGIDWSEQNYPFGYTSYYSIPKIDLFSKSYEKVVHLITPHLDNYIKILDFDLKTKDLHLSSFWINVMNQGCRHPWHNHPLSVISGTIYLTNTTDKTAIRFEDPRQPFFMARPALKKPQSLYLSEKTNAGDIILFESWLKHEVPPVISTKPRVSLSFNFDLK